MLEPFMPSTAKKIVSFFDSEIRKSEDLSTWGLYENGKKVVEKPEILFARMDAKKVLEEVENNK